MKPQNHNNARTKAATHQRSPEVPLARGVVDAGEQLVEVGPLIDRLLPEGVCATDVPGRDDLQQGLVLYPPVLLEDVGFVSRGGKGTTQTKGCFSWGVECYSFGARLDCVAMSGGGV